MLVTTATSQRSKPSPSRRMPPRAVSSTAASTAGFISTFRALCGPLQSPLSMRRSSMKMPSVQVMPTRRPVPRRMWAMKRVVVVLPLTPVTATMGMRPSSPVGKEQFDDRLADRAGNADRRLQVHPQARGRVDLDDHAALLVQGPADVARPPRRRRRCPGPPLAAASTARAATCGMHPLGHVDGRAAGAEIAHCGGSAPPLPAGGTESGVYPCSASTASATASSLILLSTVAWSSPRRGSALTSSTNSRDGVDAVAEHLGRLAAGGRHHPPAHDQQAIVVAGGEPLDDDLLAGFPCSAAS